MPEGCNDGLGEGGKVKGERKIKILTHRGGDAAPTEECYVLCFMFYILRFTWNQNLDSGIRRNDGMVEGESFTIYVLCFMFYVLRNT